MTNNRKYLPTVAELIDRLSIIQLKEVFIKDHKEEYAQEIQDIVHDLNEMNCAGDMIRAIIVLSQFNLHIWHNESAYRKDGFGAKLELTHALNGIRNTAKNKIQENHANNERKDYKIDCIAAEYCDWEPSWEKS